MQKIKNRKLNQLFLFIKANTDRLWLIVLLAFHLLTQLPYLTKPFNVDEAQYAFKAMRLLGGYGFYSASWDNKLPGIDIIFALTGIIFGQISPLTVRLLTLFVTTITVWSFFLIVSKLFRSRISLVSSFLFAIFLVDPGVQGNMASTEIFAVSFLLMSIWCFISQKKLLAKTAPFLLGATLLFRPTMIFTVALTIVLVNKTQKSKIKQSFWSLFGKVALPLVIVVIFMLFTGNIGQFFDWVIVKNFSHFQTPFTERLVVSHLSSTLRQLFADAWLFWLLGLFGLLICLNTKDKKIRVVYFLVATSLASVLFSGWFFQHFFIELIFQAALFAGLFIDKVMNAQNKLKLAVVFLLSALIVVGLVDNFIDKQAFAQNRTVKRRLDKTEEINFTDAGYFRVLDLIKNTKPSSIFVWDETPLVYVLAKYQPITYFSYKYPLLPDNLLPAPYRGFFPNYKINQEKLIEDLNRNQPELIIVHMDDNLDWERKNFSAFFTFLDNYELVEFTDQFALYRNRHLIFKL